MQAVAAQQFHQEGGEAEHGKPAIPNFRAVVPAPRPFFLWVELVRAGSAAASSRSTSGPAKEVSTRSANEAMKVGSVSKAGTRRSCSLQLRSRFLGTRYRFLRVFRCAR